MDGGSGPNILYAATVDRMGILRSSVRLSEASFYRIIPGAQAMPLKSIPLPITFRKLTNFYKEVITFEVVAFLGTYHSLLWRPCYAKFMAVPIMLA
jgi:hypothetical protein